MEEAKHILQRSLIRKPDSSAARKLLGEVLRLIAENVAQQQEQSGLTADARRTGQKQQAMSLFNKATVLRNQGKFDEAIVVLLAKNWETLKQRKIILNTHWIFVKGTRTGHVNLWIR